MKFLKKIFVIIKFRFETISGHEIASGIQISSPNHLGSSGEWKIMKNINRHQRRHMKHPVRMMKSSRIDQSSIWTSPDHIQLLDSCGELRSDSLSSSSRSN